MSAGDVAKAATAIVTDPCLPQLTRQVLELQRVTAGKGGTGAPSRGIGLCEAVTPVRLFAYHVKHPWVVPSVAVGLGIAIYLAGRASR